LTYSEKTGPGFKLVFLTGKSIGSGLSNFRNWPVSALTDNPNYEAEMVASRPKADPQAVQQMSINLS
jgi:hypothetical protein